MLSFGKSLIVLSLAVAGCSSSSHPTPPPAPSVTAEKSDGTGPSCKHWGYVANECYGGWQCDENGKYLSYVGACTAPVSVIESCGGDWAPCFAPANATATCNDDACGFTCNSGYAAAGKHCEVANTIVNAAFAATLPCAGGQLVNIGLRPPSTTGQDVICWEADAPDQHWTYDVAHRLLVNAVNSLALKVRADGSLTVGTSATDGDALTLVHNGDGSYSFAFDDGNLVGIQNGNCEGGLYQSIAPGHADYITTFTKH